MDQFAYKVTLSTVSTLDLNDRESYVTESYVTAPDFKTACKKAETIRKHVEKKCEYVVEILSVECVGLYNG